MKKIIVFAIILSIMVLLGWAVTCYFTAVPPAESTSPEPVTVLPPSTNEITNNVPEPKPATPDYKPQVSDEEAIGSQHIATDKLIITDSKPTKLSDYNASMKIEENKGFEIMPGVNVKSGIVHVDLDQEDNRCLEIGRNRSNSNNQYQMVLKKKF